MADIPTKNQSKDTKRPTFETKQPLVSSNIETTHKLLTLSAEVEKIAARTQSQHKIVNILPDRSSLIPVDVLHGGILKVPASIKEKVIYTLPSYGLLFGTKKPRNFDVFIRNDSPFEVTIQGNGINAEIDGSNTCEGPCGTSWHLICSEEKYTLVR